MSALRPAQQASVAPSAERYATRAGIGTALRQQQTADVITLYVERGKSIRHVAATLHLSYGKVHQLLTESGTARRPWGSRRRPPTTCHQDGSPQSAPAPPEQTA